MNARRRKTATLAILFAGLFPMAFAADDVATIDELRVPASPAFVLMGISPSSVERPSTPRAFALSLVSATETSDSNFPDDVALEFSPYWWKSRPNLSFEDYYYGKKQAGTDERKKKLAETIRQTLAISLGSVDLLDFTGVAGTRMGLGTRFSFIQGKPSPQLLELKAAVQKVALEVLDRCVPDDPTEPLDEPCIKQLESKLKTAATNVTQAPRTGWIVEFAAAIAADFPDDDAAAVDTSRWGGWLTASYRKKPKEDGKASNLTFVMVGRYLQDDMGLTTVDKIDVGARLIWTADPSVMPPLSFSFEHVQRFVSGGMGDTDKTAVVLEYQTPLDNISLIASYGADFRDDFTGKESLISTLGINFGFGRGPVIEIPDLKEIAGER